MDNDFDNVPAGAPISKPTPRSNRPAHTYKPDANVYEPESLKKARRIAEGGGAMTDEQARREQGKNKGSQVR